MFSSSLDKPASAVSRHCSAEEETQAGCGRRLAGPCPAEALQDQALSAAAGTLRCLHGQPAQSFPLRPFLFSAALQGGILTLGFTCTPQLGTPRPQALQRGPPGRGHRPCQAVRHSQEPGPRGPIGSSRGSATRRDLQ